MLSSAGWKLGNNLFLLGRLDPSRLDQLAVPNWKTAAILHCITFQKNKGHNIQHLQNWVSVRWWLLLSNLISLMSDTPTQYKCQCNLKVCESLSLWSKLLSRVLQVAFGSYCILLAHISSNNNTTAPCGCLLQPVLHNFDVVYTVHHVSCHFLFTNS